MIVIGTENLLTVWLMMEGRAVGNGVFAVKEIIVYVFGRRITRWGE